MLPRKINPDDVRDERLATLNSYRDELIGFLFECQESKDQDFEKEINDALKVINCLRFIIVNEEFIRYAFTHKEDLRVYTFLPRDKDNGVLRDFDNTSFHLNGYSSVDKCLSELNEMVKQVEKGYLIAKKRNKLKPATKKFRYDKDVGCLDVRCNPFIVYVAELDTAEILSFEELYAEITPLFDGKEDAEVFAIAFQKMEKYFGQRLRYQSDEYKSGEIVFTEKFLIDYMEKEGYRHRTTRRAHELIEAGEIVVTMISSPLKAELSYDSPDSWSYVFAMLDTPATYRPYKKLAAGVDRTIYWDPSVGGKPVKRKVKEKRGSEKPPGWEWSKKVSATALPINGKTHFYEGVKFPVGLGYRQGDCLHKKNKETKMEKYVWLGNVASNTKWWLGETKEDREPFKSVGLKRLREYLDDCVKKGIVPKQGLRMKYLLDNPV